MSDLYPLSLRLTGRRVVVVGAGAVAARRVPRLLAAGAHVVVIDPSPSRAVRELADQLDMVLRPYASGDLHGAWLVHACTSDPDVQARVAADADSAGIWCVRADAGGETSAATPATGTAAGVTIAVTSGDPRRSGGVRDAVLDQLNDGSLAVPASPERKGGGRVVLVGGGPGIPT